MLIETREDYKYMLARIAALEEHSAALRELQALALAHRELGRIEAADLDDMAPLGDALGDTEYTLRGLKQAAGEWEELEAYGRARGRAEPGAYWFHGPAGPDAAAK